MSWWVCFDNLCHIQLPFLGEILEGNKREIWIRYFQKSIWTNPAQSFKISQEDLRLTTHWIVLSHCTRPPRAPWQALWCRFPRSLSLRLAWPHRWSSSWTPWPSCEVKVKPLWISKHRDDDDDGVFSFWPLSIYFGPQVLNMAGKLWVLAL